MVGQLGIDTLINKLATALERCNALGRPMVTVSFAQSLDGCLTVRRGIHTALSGPESMRLTHQLRAAHQAILVGIGTILSDDPSLTVRLVEGNNPQAVVLDTHLRTPLDSRLMLHATQKPWIATKQNMTTERSKPYESRGAKIVNCEINEKGVIDLNCLLPWLYEQGICTLMVEGGARVISSFFAQHFVDQVMITVAPIFLNGLPALENSLFEKKDGVSTRPRLVNPDYQVLGRDMVIWGSVSEESI